MGFNADKFQSAKMVARTEKVECEALRDFFDEGDELVWEVRGLTSNEMFKCMEAEKRNGTVASILEAIKDASGQVEAMRKAIGLTKATPGEVAKRLEMLVIASVNPTVNLEQAVLLAERFAVDFTYITNKITALTGKGFDLVKREAASQPTADYPSA